jgi:phosphate/sulfate permease
MESATLLLTIALVFQPPPSLSDQAHHVMRTARPALAASAYPMQRSSKKWTKTKGALVGGLVGAGVAAGYGAWYCRPENACDGEQLGGALFFAPFGAGIGAATGAFIAWIANR